MTHTGKELEGTPCEVVMLEAIYHGLMGRHLLDAQREKRRDGYSII
jgi:hypothetical protein